MGNIAEQRVVFRINLVSAIYRLHKDISTEKQNIKNVIIGLNGNKSLVMIGKLYK